MHISDGKIDIQFSSDDMKLTADIYPPIGEGQPLRMDTVNTLLAQMRIHEYDAVVHLKELEEEIFKCNTEHRIIKGILLAEGKKAVGGQKAHWEINKTLWEKAKKIIEPEESENINHKKVSPFTIIKKNQKLGFFREQRDSQPGMTLRGEVINPPSDNKEYIEPGENVLIKDNIAFAKESGLFVIDKDSFYISRILPVKGNVDYHTGHIYFPGNVEISGDVVEGFYLYTAGYCHVKQVLEATKVMVKGNLIVDQGIVGRQNGICKIGGTLESKYIENCCIQCRGDISVKSSLLHSLVFSMGTLKMGDKGHVIGGKIHTAKGMKLYDVGSKHGVYTYLQAGTDFIAQQKLDVLKKKQMIIAMKLSTWESLLKDKLKQSLTQSGDPEIEKIQKAISQGKKVLEKITKALNQVISNLSVHKDASIQIRGSIHPGVIIEICQQTITIQAEKKNVAFTFDETANKIVESSLK